MLFVALAACQSAPTPGAACSASTDCASPLACRFGRCRSECAANRDCPVGARCLLAEGGVGVCSLDVDQGCETGTGRVCPSGLVCVADHCEQVCSASLGCATGSICTPTTSGASYCAPSGGGDAGADDAGADDASLDAGPIDVDAGPGQGVQQACIGDGFICAATAPTGEVYCWGSAARNALGGGPAVPSAPCSGDRSDVATALPVALLHDVDQLVCGRSWVCAHVVSDGSVRCWGESNWGTVSPTVPSSCERTPQAIAGVTFTSGELAATSELVCALDRTMDTVQCWGGDLGTLTPEETAPASVYRQLSNVTPISAAVRGSLSTPRHIALSEGMPNYLDGTGGACAIDSRGDVYCWGHNRLGQVGSTPSTAITTAAHVVGMTVVATQVVATNGFACALGMDEQVWCWGIDEHGELARPRTDPSVVPCTSGSIMGACSGEAQPYTGIHFSSISSTLASTVCGVASAGGVGVAGDVYCWGSPEFGMAGSTTTAIDDPMTGHIVRPDGRMPLSNVQRVVVGWRNACAIDASGTLWCWGANDHLQLQDTTDATPHTRAVPLHVP
jgi:hypothetical protein